MSATNLFGHFWYEVGNLTFYKIKMDNLRPPYPLFASAYETRAKNEMRRCDKAL